MRGEEGRDIEGMLGGGADSLPTVAVSSQQKNAILVGQIAS